MKKTPVACGNIKSIFASMSKPKESIVAEMNDEGTKEEEVLPSNITTVKEEFIIQPFENKVSEPEKPDDKNTEVQRITDSSASG